MTIVEIFISNQEVYVVNSVPYRGKQLPR